MWHVTQWVVRTPPTHILPAFLNLNGRTSRVRSVKRKSIFAYLTWFLRKIFEKKPFQILSEGSKNLHYVHTLYIIFLQTGINGWIRIWDSLILYKMTFICSHDKLTLVKNKLKFTQKYLIWILTFPSRTSLRIFYSDLKYMLTLIRTWKLIVNLWNEQNFLPRIFFAK